MLGEGRAARYVGSQIDQSGGGGVSGNGWGRVDVDSHLGAADEEVVSGVRELVLIYILFLFLLLALFGMLWYLNAMQMQPYLSSCLSAA